MISVTELRRGVTFEMDGELWRVLGYQHQKIGRGGATIKTKLRNIRTGATIDWTFNSGERVQDIRLEGREVQYLYNDGTLYYFMDMETYEQPALSAEVLGDVISYLKEGQTLSLSMHEGQAVEVELPVTVDLVVVETTPGFKGDTASGGGKPATLETGVVVQVPFFIEVGDVVRVDTRNAAYVTRVTE